MFRGTFEHTIDDKGRVSVPVHFREQLQANNDDRLVITNFIFQSVRCLDVYPYAAWVELEQGMLAKPRFDQRILQLQNYYLASAQDCTLDKQGRILLPVNLRQYANLNRDVVFTAALDKFRIWDREAWNQVFGQAERSLMERPEELGGLGL